VPRTIEDGAMAAARSGLEALLRSGVFAVTAESVPPLTSDPDAIVASAADLKGHADAVNVTESPAAHVHVAPLAAAKLWLDAGIEPVLQVTTRDRNRLALQADLLAAAALGIRNILCLRGDDPSAGDQPEAKPVFDLDARDLIETAARMRDKGELPSGRAIAHPPALVIGASDIPVDPQPGWEPKGLAAKRAAGADFVQTQFCFDLGVIERYIARLKEAGLVPSLPLLVGIGPIPSAASARWMRDKLWGVAVPDAVIARLERARDGRAEGRRLCIELLQALKEMPGVAGAHLMAPRMREELPAIIEESGVRRGRPPAIA